MVAVEVNAAKLVDGKERGVRMRERVVYRWYGKVATKPNIRGKSESY
jgi:hypothetical protein